MKAKTMVIGGVELENAGILSTTRSNWIVNKEMPDSITTKITEPYFPMMPKDFSAEVEFCWTFQNTLKILYTNKPGMWKANLAIGTVRQSESKKNKKGKSYVQIYRVLYASGIIIGMHKSPLER